MIQPAGYERGLPGEESLFQLGTRKRNQSSLSWPALRLPVQVFVARLPADGRAAGSSPLTSREVAPRAPAAKHVQLAPTEEPPLRSVQLPPDSPPPPRRGAGCATEAPGLEGFRDWPGHPAAGPCLATPPFLAAGPPPRPSERLPAAGKGEGGQRGWKVLLGRAPWVLGTDRGGQATGPPPPRGSRRPQAWESRARPLVGGVVREPCSCPGPPG
ncbi:PREDICTED: formin-like protein 5-like [Elephantulus edwardii]|uniref:formin-like protein 5-like n=1 Tax=Elephantulus edwardii TaxID=28737 RepID=UPI0003F096DC|nr:PREDICTED: formin-like protein 5-like [Elephantulus edwardii]